jgi:CPA2 family monovalent cation:H+ antiporter-2
VIPEELETSVEIVARVLGNYLVPQREIEAFLAELRSGGYEVLRSPAGRDITAPDLRFALSDLEVATLRVQPRSPVAGKRLADTDLRRVFGITVVAIRREERVIANPGGGTVVEAGDALVVLGLNEEISTASGLFDERAGLPVPDDH